MSTVESQEDDVEEGEENEVDEIGGRDLEVEDVHDILRNSRRQNLIRRLYHLDRNDVEGVTVQTVSAAIAADEEDVAIEDVTDEQRRRVYISLTQTHIPKLEDMDVLSDVQQLKPGPNLSKVVNAMDATALVINPDRIVSDLKGGQ